MKRLDILSIKPKSPMEKAEVLVELKNRMNELKAELDPLKEKYDEYRADLLAVTQDLDVLTLKTGKYTISRVKKEYPSVTDFETLKASLEKADIPYITEEVFAPQMSEVFKQAIKEDRELDGLEAKVTEYIQVRITDKK